MIELTQPNGTRHFVAPENVARITEAGPASQWHGTRSIVKLYDGATLEVQEGPREIKEAIEKQNPEAGHD